MGKLEQGNGADTAEFAAAELHAIGQYGMESGRFAVSMRRNSLVWLYYRSVGPAMTDPFDELLDSELMSRISETTTDRDTPPKEAPAPAVVPTRTVVPPPAPEQVREALAGMRVCPFCGLQSPEIGEACPRCRMDDTPGSRQATKARIGPWYLLQSRNPAAPGMKYSTLIALIARRSISAKSVLRGPTTHQLWRYAAHVRGVSREFGLCYSCAATIENTASSCPQCGRSQEPPAEPDFLLDAPNANGNGNGRAAAHSPVVVEPVPSTQIVRAPSAPTTVATSLSSRMRDLNRHHERAEQDASSAMAARPRPSGRVVSAMDLASALQSGTDGYTDEPSRMSLLKVAAILFLLVGCAAAAVLYYKPEYRVQSVNWLNTSWVTVKGAVDRAIESPNKTPQEADAVLAPETPRVATPVRPAPIVVEPAPVVATPVAPVVETPVVVATPTPPPEPVVDLEAAKATARDLFRQAVAAEQKEDFASAIRIYEEILKLPEKAHQGNLQIRLKLARQQAAQSSAQ